MNIIEFAWQWLILYLVCLLALSLEAWLRVPYWISLVPLIGAAVGLAQLSQSFFEKRSVR